MVGWHHQLDGHGFGWTPGVGDGQGGLACLPDTGIKPWSPAWEADSLPSKPPGTSSYFTCQQSNINKFMGYPSGSVGKESACNTGDLGSIPSWKDPLEKEMATHSSIPAWRIPWTEEPGRLQSVGSQRIRPDCVTFTFTRVQPNTSKFYL